MAREKTETEDFDVFFDKMLDQELKARAKEVKIFNHPIHNYSTGILPLDYMFNPKNPGILGGSLVMFAGETHSGKTTVLMNMSRDTLSKGHKVVYIDAEGGLTDNFSQLFGITKYGTPGFKYVKSNLKVEQYYKILTETLENLQGKPDPVLIGIDSVPQLYPENDISKGVRVGGNNQTFNNMLKPITRLLGNTNALIVMINSVYASMAGQAWLEEYKIAGGMMIQMRSNLTCITHKRSNPSKDKCGKDEHYFTKDEDSGNEVVYRQKLGLRIVKNKWAPLDKSSKLDYYLNTKDSYVPTGLDNAWAMLQTLKEAGELRYAGNAGYKMDEMAMSWKDWEHACYGGGDILTKVVNKTMAVLDKQYNQ